MEGYVIFYLNGNSTNLILDWELAYKITNPRK